MEENVIQIKSGITINVELNVKSRIYEKKIMFGIVLHIVVKMDNIQQVLLTIQYISVMKLQKKQKQFQQILMKRSYKQNFYSIIDNCKSLPLYDKLSSKTKAFIAISRHR